MRLTIVLNHQKLKNPDNLWPNIMELFIFLGTHLCDYLTALILIFFSCDTVTSITPLIYQTNGLSKVEIGTGEFR